MVVYIGDDLLCGELLCFIGRDGYIVGVGDVDGAAVVGGPAAVYLCAKGKTKGGNGIVVVDAVAIGLFIYMIWYLADGYTFCGVVQEHVETVITFEVVGFFERENGVDVGFGCEVESELVGWCIRWKEAEE